MSELMGDAPARAREQSTEAARLGFEAEAMTVRQCLTDSRAAARLLIGAYAYREVSDADYVQAIGQLAESAGLQLNVQRHQQILLDYRDRMGLRPGRDRLQNIARHRGVLVVIAQPEGTGWPEFFSAVFGHYRSAVVSPAEAEDILRKPEDLAIVFHDLSNAHGTTRGVQVIEQIKEAHFDLPVVVFSDRNDVREMYRCLRAGASGYFCYGTTEGHDRESVAAFEQFDGMVRDAIPPESWRRLWKKLQTFTGPTPHAEGYGLYRRAVSHMRRAYLFLTADMADPRTRLLAANDALDGDVTEGLGRHAAVACGSALEAVVRHIYREYHRRMGASPIVLKRLNRKVTEVLEVLEKANEITPTLARKAGSVWAIRSIGAHGEGRVSLAVAEAVFSDTIEVLRELFLRYDLSTSSSDENTE
jgi:CheY-like chemotaxis protein